MGVTVHSAKSRVDIMKFLSTANVFAFPLSSKIMCETFSVSAMECCSLGVPVVAVKQDSLSEFYENACSLVSCPITEHLQEFVDEIVNVITDTSKTFEISRKEQELASKFTFKNSVDEFEKIIMSYGKIPEVHNLQVIQPSSSGKKRVAFILDNGFVLHPLDAKNLYTSKRGLTGSEISMFKYAEGLTKLGHDVSIFSMFNENVDVFGCKCIKYDELIHYCGQRWDAAVAVMTPNAFPAFKNCGIKLFNQQVNDFNYCKGWENYTDIITAPSEPHMNYLKTLTTFDNWRVVPNGCTPSQYMNVEKTPGKMVYISSPDRGLHWLLEAYPEIKRRVPNATLDIFYDWDRFYESVKNDTNESAFRLRYIKGAVSRLESLGVKHHKGISRIQMARELSRASVLAYPVDTLGFTEGFSVSTLEAAVAGCVPVIVGADALEHIYTGYVPCIPPMYINHKREWIDEVCNVLTDKEHFKSWQDKGKKLADIYDWKILVPKFAEILGL